MPALELRDLSKQFGSAWAVEGVTLAVEPQARLIILGRSGAGKTTLLRMVAGLESPDRGDIRLCDKLANKLPPHQRDLALVSQDFALYPQLTVLENLLAALAPLNLNRDDRDARIAEALGWFHIADLVQRRPSELSGGQAQRVALAKAVVRRPKLLLLDEPLSQLDCLLRAELRELLERIVEHYATTLVLVTHDPIDALRMGTHIGILENGRLVQFGNPETVYANPTSAIAAELLSPFGINWLSAAETLPGQSEQIGFRPEDARCRPDDPSPNSLMENEEEITFHGRLESSRHLGFTHLLTVETADKYFRCFSEKCYTIGSPMKLAVAKQKLLSFSGG